MNVLKSIIVWLVGIVYVIFFFPLTFLIWLLVLLFDREREIIHWILNWQSRILVWLLPIWKIRIEGREKGLKETPFVIISNHQSILDILLINCLRYRFKWISKIENMKIPVLGWYLRMADYIIINRGDKESKEEMMEKSFQYLKGGTSIMMFPEGTRSVDGEIGFFKRGAFQLAINAHVPVLPVVLDGSGGVLPKHGLIFTTGHKIRIKVLDPVMPESFNTDDPDILSRNFSNFMIEALKELRGKS
ncbi:MAG: lysophospholipid acyltransferase family protein [Bacteroidia bacterium]|nr:lysophospholipid acyltransferase family protein [Bacteroidia bacterium]